MANLKHRPSYGFTIVELLIVIVVIGILAAIVIVSFNGVQKHANDVSVQTDLKNAGELITVNAHPTYIYPNDEATLSTQGLRISSRAAYGNPIVSGGTFYNALYCATVTGYSPSHFAIVASSLSGNVYVFRDDTIQSYPTASWTGGSGTICPDVLSVSAGNSAAGIWMYNNSAWKAWLIP